MTAHCLLLISKKKGTMGCVVLCVIFRLHFLAAICDKIKPNSGRPVFVHQTPLANPPVTSSITILSGSQQNMDEKVKEKDVGDDHDHNLDDQVVNDDDSLKDKLQESDHEKDELPQQEEEEAIKKRYGGILPKKKPLISKDHERAFFDSADWALGKPKGPLEALRPKLQPTPQQQGRSRRSAYAPAHDCDVDTANIHPCSEDEDTTSVAAIDNNSASQN